MRTFIKNLILSCSLFFYSCGDSQFAGGGGLLGGSSDNSNDAITVDDPISKPKFDDPFGDGKDFETGGGTDRVSVDENGDPCVNNLKSSTVTFEEFSESQQISTMAAVLDTNYGVAFSNSGSTNLAVANVLAGDSEAKLVMIWLLWAKN